VRKTAVRTVDPRRSARKPDARKSVARKPVARKSGTRPSDNRNSNAGNLDVRSADARSAEVRNADVGNVEVRVTELNSVMTMAATVVTVEQVVAKTQVLRSHKFSVGETVLYTSSPISRPGASGSYRVVKLLPSEGDDYQYRIKNPGEAFERVAKESQLEFED
jgi:hypothetical protein